MFTKLLLSGFCWLGRVCRNLAVEVFEAVIKHAKKKIHWLINNSKTLYSRGLESYQKSFFTFVLQIAAFGLGFYTIIFFLPEKITQLLDLIPEVSNAPYFTVRSILAGLVGWAIDDLFPVTPISAFKISLRKAILLIFTYLLILVSFGYKTAIRLVKHLVESFAICLNYGQET